MRGRQSNTKVPFIMKFAWLPQVASDAVLLFRPHNPGESAAAIQRVLHSPTLRTKVKKRPEPAAKFTSEECARKHLDVYWRIPVR